MSEPCTLYEAIALLASGDLKIAERYKAMSGPGGSGKHRLNIDFRYLDRHLPGAEVVRAKLAQYQPKKPVHVSYRDGSARPLSKNTKRRAQLQQRFVGRRRFRIMAKIMAAMALLGDALRAGRVTAYVVSGAVLPDFWMAHPLDGAEARLCFFEQQELLALIEGRTPATVSSEITLDAIGNRDFPKADGMAEVGANFGCPIVPSVAYDASHNPPALEDKLAGRSAAQVNTTQRLPNKRGPKPHLRHNIRDRMVTDYADSPEQLSTEKQVVLLSNYALIYGVKSISTVNLARTEAIAKLRQTPAKL